MPSGHILNTRNFIRKERGRGASLVYARFEVPDAYAITRRLDRDFSSGRDGLTARRASCRYYPNFLTQSANRDARARVFIPHI